MQQAQEQSFDMALFQFLSRHCSETGKWSVWLLASEVSRSGKTCKQALESASDYLIGSFCFCFCSCSVFGAEVNQHSRTSPTQTHGEWEEGSRLLW